MKINPKKISGVLLILFVAVGISFAQRRGRRPQTKPKAIIFAVVEDGKQIEPITYIEKGKLKGVGDDQITQENAPNFVKTFYRRGTKYNMIFGGDDVGTVTVVKDLAATDCAKNQADISIQSATKPKGFVMALATNADAKRGVKGLRQLPTSAERAEIEKLVMAEMTAKNVPVKNIGELRYHNLTKINVDNDKNAEFVGSYWYNTGDKKRSLLFFIADKKANGKITMPFSKFEEFSETDVASGDIKSLDEGMYHELLIDMFDYDGDGTAEIFTVAHAFEGNNFNVYKRIGGKWTRVLETSNYHCAF